MRHLHASLLALAMTWTTLLMTSGVSAQSLHYNQGLLKKYVRAAQQLRRELYDFAFDIVMRATTIQATMASRNAEMNTKKASGRDAALDFANSLFNISSYMKLYYAPAAVVYGVHSYTDVNDKIFKTVVAAHNVQYNEDLSEATVLKDGVYSVTYRVQMGFNYYSSTDLFVYDTDGSQLHQINFQWFKSCTPTQEVFSLAAGSRIELSSMLPYISYYSNYPFRYMGGRPYASQLIVEYVSSSS